MTLEWLNKARDEAKELLTHQVSIYGGTQCLCELQPADQFIACITQSIEKIQSIAQDDFDKDDYYPLDHNKIMGLKLGLMHLDEKTHIGPCGQKSNPDQDTLSSTDQA